MSTRGFDEIREDVLRQVDRDARVKRAAILGAASLEGLMLAAALLVIDWSNDTHILLLILSVLSYTSIALGLVALGAHTSRSIAQLAAALRMDKPTKG